MTSTTLEIQDAMKLTAGSDGFLSASSDTAKTAGFTAFTRFALSSPYGVVAAAILDKNAPESAMCIEMEFKSRGGMPPNLVRVIEHLRDEQKASQIRADPLEMRNMMATGFIGSGKCMPELPIEATSKPEVTYIHFSDEEHERCMTTGPIGTNMAG